MIHVEYMAGVWCEDDNIVDSTDDPREATCAECLRRAAAYGAAAAMRYAAVEAGKTQDPELARERDEAMRRLNMICKALEEERVFFCFGCTTLKPAAECGMRAGDVVWCTSCASRNRRALTP